MYFSKYFDYDGFFADKMHTRAIVALSNPDYIPPPDIQLYYLLEIINDLSVLGQTQFKIFRARISEETQAKLCELGYNVNYSNEDLSLVINWSKGV